MVTTGLRVWSSRSKGLHNERRSLVTSFFLLRRNRRISRTCTADDLASTAVGAEGGDSTVDAVCTGCARCLGYS